MKTFYASTLLFALAALPLASLADDCKVKIKEKNGHYKEDIKCKGHPHGHAPGRVVVRESVVVKPAVVVRQPAVVVRPAVVAQPAVVVRQPAVVVKPAVVARPAVVVRTPAPTVVVRPPAPPSVTVRVN